MIGLLDVVAHRLNCIGTSTRFDFLLVVGGAIVAGRRELGPGRRGSRERGRRVPRIEAPTRPRACPVGAARGRRPRCTEDPCRRGRDGASPGAAAKCRDHERPGAAVSRAVFDRHDTFVGERVVDHRASGGQGPEHRRSDLVGVLAHEGRGFVAPAPSCDGEYAQRTVPRPNFAARAVATLPIKGFSQCLGESQCRLASTSTAGGEPCRATSRVEGAKTSML